MNKNKATSGRKANGVAGEKPATGGKRGVDDKAEQAACVAAGDLELCGMIAGMAMPPPTAADDTEIAWTHRTINWWMGCKKVSEGCRECYAEKQCKQYGRDLWGDAAPRKAVISAPGEARNCNEAAGRMGCKDVVFCCSLSDFFEDRPDLVELRVEGWKVIRECENLVFIILTKRPENIARMLPPDWGDDGYPNVCLAATVENGTGRVMERIDQLRAVPARWRMLSAEPLLGPVDLRGRLDGIHMVVAGGESGVAAKPKVIRPMHPDWARAIRDACQEAGVAFFFKQWGSWSLPKPAAVKNPMVVEWQGLTLYFTGTDRENMAPALLDGHLWREHPFGGEVDLDRLSAYSRIEREKAASSSLRHQNPESLAEFKRYHEVVVTGFQAAFEAGTALGEIRDRKLWRAGGFGSWEAYCEAFGEGSRSHLNRLIMAASILAKLVEAAPIGAGGLPVLPLNEFQVRPLAKLPDDATRAEAWQRAVTASNGRVPVASTVTNAVIEVLATSVDLPPGGKPGEGQAPSSGEEETADAQGRRMVVQTIGSTGKSAAVFFELLREGGVRRVIDVRNSDDRQCAGFTKGDDLEFFLRTILDIDYHWSPDLAPTDEIRGMDDWQDHEKSFLALMSGREVENRVDPNLVNGACLLCSEPEPDRCHRRLVAEYLRERWSGRGIDLEITHLS